MLRKAFVSLLSLSLVVGSAGAAEPEEESLAIRCVTTPEIVTALRQQGFVPEFAGLVRLPFPGALGSGLLTIYRNDSTKDVVVVLLPDSRPSLTCLIGAGKIIPFKQNA